jgi:nucleoside-diphosphate-sugar epimerase
MRAAVEGTTSLLASAFSPQALPSLQSVIFMSTISAIFSPLRPKGHIFTESDWNDMAEREVNEKGKQAEGYVIYQASKTKAERVFWENSPSRPNQSVRMVTLCPAYVPPFPRSPT